MGSSTQSAWALACPSQTGPEEGRSWAAEQGPSTHRPPHCWSRGSLSPATATQDQAPQQAKACNVRTHTICSSQERANAQPNRTQIVGKTLRAADADGRITGAGHNEVLCLSSPALSSSGTLQPAETKDIEYRDTSDSGVLAGHHEVQKRRNPARDADYNRMLWIPTWHRAQGPHHSHVQKSPNRLPAVAGTTFQRGTTWNECP